MSKSKMLVVRVDESLLEMIKVTAGILERKESEAVRILLTRACKYWIIKGQVTNNQDKAIQTIKEQTTSVSVDEDDLSRLEAAMKLLK